MNVVAIVGGGANHFLKQCRAIPLQYDDVQLVLQTGIAFCSCHCTFCLPAAGRYARFQQQFGRGRFKTVYRGFDERQGIDVAWSKIEAERNQLTQEKRKRIVEELSLGIEFDHPNVIKVRPPCTRPCTGLHACVSTARHEQRHHHALPA